jgi:DNA-binding transcriptional LysR family regulator
MEIRQLEYFQAVSRHGSFTRAAEYLHVAQPSITNAIQKLEEELGIILFDRSQKKVALTAEGNAFLVRAERILRELKETIAEMNDFRNLNKGTIKVAVPPMIGAYLFPNIFTTFKKQFPNLELVVFEEGSLSARSMLEKEELDLGLVILPKHSLLLNTLPITQEQIVLCVSPEHRLAVEKTVAFSQLRNEQFIMLKEDSYHRQLVIDECQKYGFTPRIVFSSSQIQTIKALVASNAGVSFLMEMVTKDDRNIRSIPLSTPLDIRIGLAWKKDKYLSKASQTLIEFLTAYAETDYSRNPVRQ